MKYLYFLPFTFLLHACGGNETTAEKTGAAPDSSVTENTVPKDSAPVSSFNITVDQALLEQTKPAEKKLLVYFFGKTHAAELLSVMKAIEEIKTDTDLHTCFHYADSVCNVASELMNDEQKGLTGFYDHIDSINNLYKNISHLLPYVTFGCEAECSMPALWVNYAAFAKLAKTTEGKQDDDFFELQHFIFGEAGDNTLQAIWFDQNWDYGGNSLLGAGSHYQVLKKAQDIKPNNVFAHEIEKWENSCLTDAAEWGILYYTAEKAIEEIKKIMTLDIGTKNKKQLEKRIQELKNPGEHLQIDCEHHDCQYG